MLRSKIIAFALLAILAGGCQQASKKPDTESMMPVSTAPEPVRSQPAAAPPPPPPRSMEPELWESATIVYFDFDRSDIRPQDRAIVSAHAERLADMPRLKVRLEGHADERGSREYNIGLGERRAQAVRQALMLQGVQSGQIDTLSYGEERPAVRGQGEASWQRNRRVEFVYLP